MAHRKRDGIQAGLTPATSPARERRFFGENSRLETFVLNLDRSPDRMRSIATQLDGLGISYRRFPATDGRSMTPEEMSRWCDPAEMERRQISNGLLACTISHIRIFQTMVEERIDEALVIEDDAWISPHLPAILPRLREQLQDHELLMLYHLPAANCRLTTDGETDLREGYRLRYPMSGDDVWTTLAYLIRRPVAEGLLKANYPVRVGVDWWGELYTAGAMTSIRCVSPPICRPRVEFPSDIRRGPSNRYVQKLLDVVYKYHIFPFDQILERRRRKTHAEIEARFTLTDQPSIFVTRAAASEQDPPAGGISG